MQVEFYLAGEITQVIDSIPWVRCASGNVFPQSFPLYFYNILSIDAVPSVSQDMNQNILRKNSRAIKFHDSPPHQHANAVSRITLAFVRRIGWGMKR